MHEIKKIVFLSTTYLSYLFNIQTSNQNQCLLIVDRLPSYHLFTLPPRGGGRHPQRRGTRRVVSTVPEPRGCLDRNRAGSIRWPSGAIYQSNQSNGRGYKYGFVRRVVLNVDRQTVGRIVDGVFALPVLK